MQRAVMLAKEANFAGMEIDIARGDYLLGRFAFVMNYLGAWEISDVPTLTLGAIAPIEFFGIHEKVFVETADLLVYLAPDEHRRAGDPIHLLNGVVRGMA